MRSLEKSNKPLGNSYTHIWKAQLSNKHTAEAEVEPHSRLLASFGDQVEAFGFADTHTVPNENLS